MSSEGDGSGAGGKYDPIDAAPIPSALTPTGLVGDVYARHAGYGLALDALGGRRAVRSEAWDVGGLGKKIGSSDGMSNANSASDSGSELSVNAP